MKFSCCAMLLLFFTAAFAQETAVREIPDFDAVDSLYREDQFYFSFTYNILQQKDLGIKQNKFSAGLSGGFLRDMPINESRTVAIAAGLGYSLQNYNYNLITSEVDGERQYNLIEPNNSYDKNKLSLHFIEIPIEFRWRTSTFESHKFWRVYTGVKFSYLFYNRSKYIDGSDKRIVVNNKDLNSFRYGVYLATGYNTWNAYVYYGINPIFKKSAQLSGVPIDMRTLNVGLMFYIL